jgi:hypothetical protein
MSIDYWLDSERLQFTIPASSVSGTIDLIPFIFRLGDSSGVSSTDTNFVFDRLNSSGSSVNNRKKVAFSQIVLGKEEQLYAELDFWDHVAKRAIFWVKPLEMSSIHINVFYFYFNKNKNNNVNYISEASQKSVGLMIPLGSQGVYDTHTNIPFSILQVNGKYMVWYLSKNTSINNRMCLIYCESLNLVDFSNFRLVTNSSLLLNNYTLNKGTIFYKDGIFKMWIPAQDNYNSTYGYNIYYLESVNGITWGSATLCSGLATGLTDTGQDTCSVILKDSSYHIWISASDWNHVPLVENIFHATSTNGTSWNSLAIVISPTSIPTWVGYDGETLTGVYLCYVCLINDIYTLWFTGYSKKGIFCCDSTNGTTFSNFRTFLDPSLEGTYDINNYSTLVILQETERYIFICGAQESANTNRLFISISVPFYKPSTPSQFIWEDLFTSVLHLNPYFGYTNSVNRAAGIVSYTGVSNSYDNLSGYSINLSSSSSNINLGNSYIYDYGIMSQCIIWSKFTTGKYILSKGLYTTSSLRAYYQDTAPVFRENYNDVFDGLDNSLPDTYLWNIINGTPRINNNNLKFGSSTLEVLRTAYYIDDKFDVYLNINVLNGNVDTEWYVGIKVLNISASADFVFCFRRASGTFYFYTFLSTLGSYNTFSNLDADIVTPVSDDFTTILHVYVSNNTICFDYYYNNTWVRLDTWSMDFRYYRLEIFKKSNSVTNNTSFFATAFSINTSSVFKYNGLSRSDNVLALDTRLNYVDNTFNYLNYTLPTDWSLYSFGVSDDPGVQNTILGDTTNSFFYKYLGSININTDSLIIGSSSESMQGNYSEIFFTKSLLRSETLNLLKLSLEDNLIVFSAHYVRGYTTLYNNAISSEVFVYNQLNGDLIGRTISDTIAGFYYTQVPYVEKCFIVGFGDDLYNHFVLSDVTLQTI